MTMVGYIDLIRILSVMLAVAAVIPTIPLSLFLKKERCNLTNGAKAANSVLSLIVIVFDIIVVSNATISLIALFGGTDFLANNHWLLNSKSLLANGGIFMSSLVLNWLSRKKFNK